MGFVSFFDNFIQIAILLLAWLIVVISFFIMAIQLFVSLIEFKLTTLAGFVLVPFGLFGRTAFLAEKVLGNVVSSGVKILVLAVIVGIGSTIFGQFTTGFNNPPTISDALTLILAALSLLGLSIFGPGIANGLIAGGPQLGAGAAAGPALPSRAWGPPVPWGSARREASPRRGSAAALRRRRRGRRIPRGRSREGSSSRYRSRRRQCRQGGRAGGAQSAAPGCSIRKGAFRGGCQRRRRLPDRRFVSTSIRADLGNPHAPPSDRFAWRLRRQPCAPLR